MDIQPEEIKLPNNVEQRIKKSIEQADRGEFISWDEVKKLAAELLQKDPSK
jgi:hypothetical protein